MGGTGKTPLVIALVQELQKQGFQPAVISRGYKSQNKKWPLWVTEETPVSLSGDEPLLIAKRTKCPVVIDPNRTRAVKFLEATGKCNIILSDDGLQHYALQRDIEILVIDSQRQFGNGFLLPAGMLREPVARAAKVNFMVYNGVPAEQNLHPSKSVFSMTFNVKWLPSLSNPNKFIQLTQFKHRRVHAIAGIGNPEQFFALLRSHGLEVITHPFPDHHSYSKDDFDFLNEQNFPVIMTEKDAVKCRGLLYDAWYVEIEAILPEAFYKEVLNKLEHYANA